MKSFFVGRNIDWRLPSMKLAVSVMLCWIPTIYIELLVVEDFGRGGLITLILTVLLFLLVYPKICVLLYTYIYIYIIYTIYIYIYIYIYYVYIYLHLLSCYLKPIYIYIYIYIFSSMLYSLLIVIRYMELLVALMYL